MVINSYNPRYSSTVAFNTSAHNSNCSKMVTWECWFLVTLMLNKRYSPTYSTEAGFNFWNLAISLSQRNLKPPNDKKNSCQKPFSQVIKNKSSYAVNYDKNDVIECTTSRSWQMVKIRVVGSVFASGGYSMDPTKPILKLSSEDPHIALWL